MSSPGDAGLWPRERCSNHAGSENKEAFGFVTVTVLPASRRPLPSCRPLLPPWVLGPVASIPSEALAVAAGYIPAACPFAAAPRNNDGGIEGPGGYRR